MIEKKYIELVKRLRNRRICIQQSGGLEDFPLLCEAADAIEELVTDGRPVVLCRDCKCYRQSHYIDKHMECARSGFPVHSVDFCSFSEKREES